jgi:hypothetical protein
MIVSVTAIERQAIRRGKEYADAVKATGKVSGDCIEIDDLEFKAILDRFPSKLGLGDLVEIAVKPIAKLLQMDCLETDGSLKPESPCAQRRDWLNSI